MAIDAREPPISGLPVRTEADGLDERLQTKIVDSANPDTQHMEVDTDGNAHIEVHGNDPTGTDVVLILTEEGRSTSRGDYNAVTNTKPSSNGLIAHERNASKTEVHQTKRVSAIDSTDDTDVTALDVAIRDESGNPFTETNPLPTYVTENPADEIFDYDEAVDTAKDAFTNHDYAVTALKRLILDSCWCSGSGRAKFELQVETGVGTDTYVSQMVGFTSTSYPNVDLLAKRRLTVAAGVKARVIKTNRDNQAQSLYTTFIGVEADV